MASKKSRAHRDRALSPEQSSDAVPCCRGRSDPTRARVSDGARPVLPTVLGPSDTSKDAGTCSIDDRSAPDRTGACRRRCAQAPGDVRRPRRPARRRWPAGSRRPAPAPRPPAAPHPRPRPRAPARASASSSTRLASAPAERGDPSVARRASDAPTRVQATRCRSRSSGQDRDVLEQRHQRLRGRPGRDTSRPPRRRPRRRRRTGRGRAARRRGCSGRAPTFSRSPTSMASRMASSQRRRADSWSPAMPVHPGEVDLAVADPAAVAELRVQSPGRGSA